MSTRSRQLVAPRGAVGEAADRLNLFTEQPHRVRRRHEPVEEHGLHVVDRVVHIIHIQTRQAQLGLGARQQLLVPELINTNTIDGRPRRVPEDRALDERRARARRAERRGQGHGLRRVSGIFRVDRVREEPREALRDKRGFDRRRRPVRADRRERAPLLQLVNRTGGRVVLSREGVEGRQSVRCGTAKRFACTAEASVPEGVVGALSSEF